MTKHRSHSAAFKRQVAEEFVALTPNVQQGFEENQRLPCTENSHR